MAFEYGEEVDSSGNITHTGSWGAKSIPKDAMARIIEDLRLVYDEPTAGTTAALALKAPIVSPTFTGVVTSPSFVGTLTGNASTATALQTPQNIGASGDVTGSVLFNGTGSAIVPLTLASSGVIAGTYPKVTVDAKGRVTSGAALLASDVPTLNQSTTGSAANISNQGTVTLASATEQNQIDITAPGYAFYYPVKLLNFHWYDDVISIGAIRSDTTTISGLGIYVNSILTVGFPKAGGIQINGHDVPYIVASSFGTTGYIKWSNGYTEQWGQITIPASSSTTVTYTYGLATLCYAPPPTTTYTPSSVTTTVDITAISTTTMTIKNNASVANTVFWKVFGVL